MSPSKVQVAAGTVTLRQRPGKQPQVLLVHRPTYDDWTLPKGKLEPDEYEAVAAARETLEETGVQVRLHQPLEMIRYPISTGMKAVHYWLASPRAITKRKPDREVDKVVWLSPKAAFARMTYAHERDVVQQGLDATPTTALLVVRHAKAMDRKNWSGRDQARPITARGRKQAKLLIPLLDAFGVERLTSSSSTRCMQTLAPFGKASGRDVEGWTVLSEEIGEDNPKGVAKHMLRLAEQAASTGVATAVCGHRPVLPTMLAGIGVPNRMMQTAATVIVHLDADARVVAHEFHRPRA
ncbi:NUDIX domain-containing protein [Propioniciclava sp.]|uniref:NUDIX hydrolase n=1 Tax=Propioniciclava sp. TaxID=2038686 RepID=UPI0026130417|nr:NUDIX domain-containing protein [Propioniciclava sp.]